MKKTITLSIALASLLALPAFAHAAQFLSDLAAAEQAQIDATCGIYQAGGDFDTACRSCLGAGENWNSVFTRCEPSVVIVDRDHGGGDRDHRDNDRDHGRPGRNR